MIAKNKGDDISDAFRGPVGYFAIALIVIGAASAYANTLGAGDDTPTAPDKPIFGFITNAINEFRYVLDIVVPVVIIAGAVMIGLTLRLDSTHTNQKRLRYPCKLTLSRAARMANSPILLIKRHF